MKKKICILLIILILSGCSNKKYSNGELNVLNWSSYIPNDIINDFVKEYNIKVNYGTYSSNEELLAKISSSKEGTYDLIFPSDYMVELMKEKNMLQKIDKTKLINIKNISPLFLNQSYDPLNEYSLPFLGATAVIAVNRDYIKDDIKSYNDLLNPKYKNDIVLIDDQRIIIGLSLLANGYDMNSTNKDELNTAKNWLLKLKDNVKAFDSDSPKNFLITKETNLGIIWNAEAILAKEENPNIEIIYPVEGHAISIDNYVLTKGAKNVDNAYLFIDYLLRYDIGERLVNSYPYINTNDKYINYSYFELNQIISSGSYIKNIGEYISLYDRIWADIK